MASKILLAIDGSEIGWKALDWALNLAKIGGSKIVIIHVASPGVTVKQPIDIVCEPPVLMMPETPRCFRKRIVRVLEVLEEARRKAEESGLTVDFVIRHGNPSEELVKESRKGYDLVIIGNTSFTKRRLGLGSVAEKILNAAPCPVLVVK